MAKRTRTKAATLPSPFLLPMRITPLGDGRFLGRCSDLPGLNVEADSIQEVLRLAPKIARSLIEAMREKGVGVPDTLDRAKPPVNIHLVVAA